MTEHKNSGGTSSSLHTVRQKTLLFGRAVVTPRLTKYATRGGGARGGGRAGWGKGQNFECLFGCCLLRPKVAAPSAPGRNVGSGRVERETSLDEGQRQVKLPTHGVGPTRTGDSKELAQYELTQQDLTSSRIH